MNETNQKVLFDPGYAPLVIDSIGQVGYIYYTFSAIKDFKLKKINFPHTLRKLEACLKINIAFYLGCIMWASYIKQFDDAEIEGNKLLGEVVEEDEYTNEINFLIDVVKTQLPKDVKYYQGKTYNSNEQYINILETYKQFLILNNGFVNCSKTNQIVLPENIKTLSKEELDTLNDKIQDALKEKNIALLLEDYSLIF